MSIFRMYKILIVFIGFLLFSATCHTQINQSNDSVQGVVTEQPSKLSDYHEKNKNFEPITRVYAPVAIKENRQFKESIDSAKNTEEFWYVKAAENGTLFKKEEKAPPGFYKYSRAIGSVVWWVLVSIFVIAIVYFLLSSKINIFRKSTATTSSDDEANYDEENIFELPYQRLLQKAYDEKNYRLVVRLLYLQTLKILSEKSLIKYQAGLTNSIYLSQLHNSKYYDLFFKITRYYEYVWYGEFPVEAAMFQKIEQDFKKLMSDA